MPPSDIAIRFDALPAEQRVAAIRARILKAKARWNQGPLHAQFLLSDAKSLRASEGKPRRIRRALRTRDRLAALQFTVDEYDLLAGRPSFPADLLPISQGGKTDDAVHAEATAYLGQFGPEPGQTGHCELDRSAAFRLGLAGLKARITAKARTARGDKHETLLAFSLALDGLMTMVRNAARAVELAIPAASPARRRELERMVVSCHRVASDPPACFLDALHLLWFIDLGVQLADNAGLVGPGHIDRSLYSFYRDDVRNGMLTDDTALQLIEALYFHINAVVPDGLAVPVMVGGRNSRGRDVSNGLSYLCLEALRRTRLVYPTVGVCWHKRTPDTLTSLAVELISKGYSTPAFFCDATIQKGLRKYGVPPSSAHHYVNSTCVEITPVGASNVWVASPYFSTCEILLEEITSQAAAGRQPARSFSAFLNSYLRRLADRIRTEGAEPQGEARALRSRNGGKPLQSVFTRDCTARGRDIDEGGARYNWVECSFVGLANLVDSMCVIRDEVFDHQSLSFPELKQLLDSDFRDTEAIRQRFLNHHPKYGNGDAAVDGLLGKIVNQIRRACARQRVGPNGDRFIPGAFCWIMHEQLGSRCGATPDGRKAGFPFADGGGPAQGRERGGPTTAILSTTAWDHSPLIGGVAYNMKFNRRLFEGRESVNRLKDLLLTYLRRGGFEVQVNVVDHTMLKEAREKPELYRDLVVRIGGYTDYFARLSPGMQEEIMRRTEFQGW